MNNATTTTRLFVPQPGAAPLIIPAGESVEVLSAQNGCVEIQTPAGAVEVPARFVNPKKEWK